MPDTDLAWLSGHQALALMLKGAVSPVELMQAVIVRAELVQPYVNALTDTYYEQALAEARKSEQRYLTGRPRKLDGLPLVVKDELRLKGTRRTSSSLVYKDRIDSESDIIIDRLLRAGAICHAKTATPEFCLLGSCHSRLNGITRNPLNLDITPGGSSGGTGAALAAGMSTLGTGTDIGGSIRIPAAQCGVVGYKPPYGRNPEVPVFNLDFYSHSGPMTRSVIDAALMQNVISGPHDRDIATVRNRVKIDTTQPQASLSGWKVAWSMDLGFMEVDTAVVRNTERALAVLENLGATLQQVELGWDEEIIDAAHAYWSVNWASSMAGMLENHRDQLNDYTICFLERAANCSPADYRRSLEVTVEMYNRFGPMMANHDLFVCPTLSTTHIPATFTWPESEVDINGRTVSMNEERWSMAYPFNMLSRCPAISLPSGVAENGVATGVQLVGRSYDDRRVFKAAMAYETATPELFNWRLDAAIPDSI